MVWKNTVFREWLRAILCCKHLSILCKQRTYYDEADLRTLRELEQPPHRERVGINGAYRLYQSRRSRSSLRLTSWREDIKRGDGEDNRLHHKLAQIRATQQNRCHQGQAVATVATTSRTPINRAITTCTVPFKIHVVGITDRVDESSTPSVVVSPYSSDFTLDMDDGSVYELVAPTPKNEVSGRSGRRSVGIGEEEEKIEDTTS
ncbi:unnamed protein product [Peronospora belbahrii]|uniref:Uncharacterized protein n=1 Tax=Peronospora belbahrii TaxID=622444 RepID=A0AAU9KWQ2_9STRA|nr:unnamed protein product [Peronospora belbahrii]CAH0517694.1 unnamed protein product [Peronospora belbahrii]